MTDLEKELNKLQQLVDIVELLDKLSETVKEKEKEKSFEQQRKEFIENLLIHDVPKEVDEAYKVIFAHIDTVSEALGISIDIHLSIKTE